MNSSSKLNLLMVMIFTLVAAACTHAKSPLGDNGKDATFAIYPDRIKAKAELDRSSAQSFGQARTQTLNFSVCLQNLISGQNIVEGTPFAISDGQSAAIERKADIDGCVHWLEKHTVSPLAPQRNIRVHRQIRGERNHHGTVALDFNVKPWLEGEEAVQSLLGQEVFANSMSANSSFGLNDAYPVADASTASQNTHFDLANNKIEFSFTEIGQDSEFRVDRYMNLEIPYRFTLSLQPLIAHQLFSGQIKSEPITSGRLRLTFVFFASAKGEPIKDNHYLTSVQMDADVSSNGTLTGVVVVRYPHPLFASGRQTVLMQIASVDKNSEVAPQSFSGALLFLQQQGTITLLQDGRDGAALHEKFQAQRLEQKNKRIAPLESYLAGHDVTRVKTEDFPNLAIKTGWFGSTEVWQTNYLGQDELKYALRHDRLDNTDYHPGFYGYKSPLPITNRLCRAYVAFNPQLLKANSTNNFAADYVRDLKSDINFDVESICMARDPLQNKVLIKQLDFIVDLRSNVPRNVQLKFQNNVSFGIYEAKEDAAVTTTGIGVHIPGPFMGGGLIDGSYSKSWSHVTATAARLAANKAWRSIKERLNLTHGCFIAWKFRACKIRPNLG